MKHVGFRRKRKMFIIKENSLYFQFKLCFFFFSNFTTAQLLVNAYS